jgi:hypothetical protein
MAEQDRARTNDAQTDAQIDTLKPAAPEHLRQRLDRDLAVQGSDGRPSSPESPTDASPATVNDNGEQDGHANRRPDPTGTPAD